MIKRKVMYVMNVDWNWIKQRPHFIAEELAKLGHDVHVMYQYRYDRKGYQKRKCEGIRITPFYLIPRGDRYPVFRKINGWLKSKVVRKNTLKMQADCLYLTFPNQIEMIPKDFTGKVIYDCMDNHPAFISDVSKRTMIEKQERKLVQYADVVLVSSEKLIDVLVNRYGEEFRAKMVLIRNAYNGEVLPETKYIQRATDEPLTLAYFGTISSWFNFDYILKSLEEYPNIKYKLMGPCDIEIPKHDRIEYIGTVEHKDLLLKTQDAHCLIMPFEVNEIIESVDPVKLYEYINFNKNILCVRYNEVERFDPFVYFYSDYDSFKKQIGSLMNAPAVKYSSQERIEFLECNNWSTRVQHINKFL